MMTSSNFWRLGRRFCTTASAATATIRTRYAPSPTGQLHLGGLRTALYNYLLVAKHKQQQQQQQPSAAAFILRIEDTDRRRLVPGSAEALERILTRVHLDVDEGPLHGGPHAPYVQSERLSMYREHAWQLVHAGRAYVCFCDSERLTRLREERAINGLPSLYDRLCAGLSTEEVRERMAQQKNGYVIRMRIPEGSTRITDGIRGVVHVENASVDDQVLLKSDGYPTYHLAAVVDDHYMRVSHVIRGEEWLPSTVKHLHLYAGFGWTPPLFYHLPLLVDEQHQKLSKRTNHMSVEALLDAGFLPEAIINFVALLGWHNSDNTEIYTLPELVSAFSLDRLRSSASVVSMEKLRWTNAQHIRRMMQANPTQLASLVRPLFTAATIPTAPAAITTTAAAAAAADAKEEDRFVRVLRVLHEKVSVLGEFVSLGRFFYQRPALDTDTEALACAAKWWHADAHAIVASVRTKLAELSDAQYATADAIHTILQATVRERRKQHKRDASSSSSSLSPAQEVMMPLRYAVSGLDVGGSLAEVFSILGRTEVDERLHIALTVNNNQ